MGVGDENNAYADGKDADVDADAGGAPPSGTPRASCQLTLLTSPARVTRVGHCGEEACKLEIAPML